MQKENKQPKGKFSKELQMIAKTRKDIQTHKEAEILTKISNWKIKGEK